MKTSITLYSLLIILSSSCSQKNLENEVKTENLTTTKEEVWKKELKYWDAVKNGDIESYIGLYHSDHLSWPSFVAIPESQDTIEPKLNNFIKAVKKGSTSFELTPFSVTIDGDLALVYYLANWKMETVNNEEQNFSEKFLHVWKRSNDTWLLVGGMSAMLKQ